MQFVKEIPRQCAMSPQVARDYFDDEALRLIDVCKLYGFDIYYSVFNAIHHNKTIIKHCKRIGEVLPPAVIGHLRSIGFDAKTEGYPDRNTGLHNIIIDLNNTKPTPFTT